MSVWDPLFVLCGKFWIETGRRTNVLIWYLDLQVTLDICYLSDSKKDKQSYASLYTYDSFVLIFIQKCHLFMFRFQQLWMLYSAMNW